MRKVALVGAGVSKFGVRKASYRDLIWEAGKACFDSVPGLMPADVEGLVVGSVLTAWRIVRCNPWTAGGIDDVRAARHDRYRITRFGWVVPAGMFPKAEADAAAARLAHELEHRAAESSLAEPALVTSSPTLSRKD